MDKHKLSFAVIESKTVCGTYCISVCVRMRDPTINGNVNFVEYLCYNGNGAKLEGWGTCLFIDIVTEVLYCSLLCCNRTLAKSMLGSGKP